MTNYCKPSATRAERKEYEKLKLKLKLKLGIMVGLFHPVSSVFSSIATRSYLLVLVKNLSCAFVEMRSVGIWVGLIDLLPEQVPDSTKSLSLEPSKQVLHITIVISFRPSTQELTELFEFGAMKGCKETHFRGLKHASEFLKERHSEKMQVKGLLNALYTY
ncbi:hypothetical protein VNO80_10995 [Phaseolus coccineus]|uniref:Uncharacterized protein n=1 Tax=Phaseolus coccineus TaxID=3886 RepID=A0AAN9NEE9_PHACN